jgi:hypothetical protein
VILYKKERRNDYALFLEKTRLRPPMQLPTDLQLSTVVIPPVAK